MKADERARKGIFLSFQYPEEIPGVTVEDFLRTAKTSVTGRPQGIMAFRRLLKEKMDYWKSRMNTLPGILMSDFQEEKRKE